MNGFVLPVVISQIFDDDRSHLPLSLSVFSYFALVSSHERGTDVASVLRRTSTVISTLQRILPLVLVLHCYSLLLMRLYGCSFAS